MRYWWSLIKTFPDPLDEALCGVDVNSGGHQFSLGDFGPPKCFGGLALLKGVDWGVTPGERKEIIKHNKMLGFDPAI